MARFVLEGLRPSPNRPFEQWKGDVVQMSNNDNKFLQRHFPVSNGALQNFMKN